MVEHGFRTQGIMDRLECKAVDIRVHIGEQAETIAKLRRMKYELERELGKGLFAFRCRQN